MDKSETRRSFLRSGTVAGLGLMAGGASVQSTLGADGAHTSAASADTKTSSPNPASSPNPDQAQSAEGYRYQPGPGGPLGSAGDRGRLIPGRRAPDRSLVPVQAPDLTKLPWEMKNGVKEFHLRAMQVRREFLPGYEMVAWGYNGSVPGPTIEANQGDRVRIVVHNDLPEPHSVHWHGFELPVAEDGVPGVTQDPIPPGGKYVYEFHLHQTGTYFYHSHIPMQESFGMVGFFIVHPKKAWEPVVDRDFCLIFQNFMIPPNQTIPDSMAMDWNWHTINGRSGPYTTPLVCRHGERVRIRLLDFSPMQHHPVHIHGHTFWLTGAGGGRIPPEAWVPANITLTAVAQARVFEFVANNPGDWLMHCHMVHHMMNHMVRQVGPRVRSYQDVSEFIQSPDNRPPVRLAHADPGFNVPGYPQKMQGMEMTEAAMEKLWNRREVQGMRHNWHMGVHGLMTVVRVLPDDLYDRVIHGQETIPRGAVFDEIVRRFSW